MVSCRWPGCSPAGRPFSAAELFTPSTKRIVIFDLGQSLPISWAESVGIVRREVSASARLKAQRKGWICPKIGNHQDVREGGEIPPLPRNCERTRRARRRLDEGEWEVGQMPLGANPVKAARQVRDGSWSAYDKAQVRRPVLWCPSPVFCSEGNKGDRCLFLAGQSAHLCAFFL